MVARGLNSSLGTLLQTQLAEDRKHRSKGRGPVQPGIANVVYMGVNGMAPTSGIQS